MKQKSDMLMGLSNNIQGSIPIDDNESKDGVLEFAGDGEAYSFNGQQGDLITAFVNNLTNSGSRRVRIRCWCQDFASIFGHKNYVQVNRKN